MTNNQNPRQAVLEAVNHPRHYNSLNAKCSQCAKPIECIDVIETMPCNKANAIKYIWRAGLKGDEIEDLKKATWYISREVQRLEKLIEKEKLKQVNVPKQLNAFERFLQWLKNSST